MADVKLDNITKIYPNNVIAIKNTTLEFSLGEFVVLVGPSGCGKSTLLRMIAGLEDITQGSMYIGDSEVNTIPPKDRDIAMVFQNYALYPHMNVFDNMAFHLKLQKQSRKEIREQVEATAKTLEIDHLLKRKPKALSGGQRQRVALGRAMVRNPAVFLLDEPLSNLDAKLRVSMRLEIMELHKKLKQQGTTFVYVTHDQTEAMTMGDRIVILDEGQVQQVASPEELYENPINIFVASFIGSPGMNFFSGKLRDDEVFIKGEKQPHGLDFHSLGMREVILGIRPEHIEVLDKKEPYSLPLTIDIVENTGDTRTIYGVTPWGNVVVKTNKVIKGSTNKDYYLKINWKKMHIFDRETTLKLN